MKELIILPNLICKEKLLEIIFEYTKISIKDYT